MKIVISMAVFAALGTVAALAQPNSSQHPRVGQLAELTFATGSAELPITDPRLTDKLGLVIAWADEHPDGLLVLDGHADPRGTAPFNVRLSTMRAKAVR